MSVEQEAFDSKNYSLCTKLMGEIETTQQGTYLCSPGTCKSGLEKTMCAVQFRAFLEGVASTKAKEVRRARDKDKMCGSSYSLYAHD